MELISSGIKGVTYDLVQRSLLWYRGHRSKIVWVTILVPKWRPGEVYPSSNFVPGDREPQPVTPFLDPGVPDFWQLWSEHISNLIEKIELVRWVWEDWLRARSRNYYHHPPCSLDFAWTGTTAYPIATRCRQKFDHFLELILSTCNLV